MAWSWHCVTYHACEGQERKRCERRSSPFYKNRCLFSLKSSPFLSILIVFSGLKVIPRERFWAFRDLTLNKIQFSYPERAVPKPLRLPQNLLQGLGKWQHFSSLGLQPSRLSYCRYRGFRWTSLQHIIAAAAINKGRVWSWWTQAYRFGTLPSRFAAKERSINNCRILEDGSIIPFRQQIIKYDL